MCEFVCQISILISAAAIVKEKKFFLLRESPLASLTDDTAEGGGGGHPHTFTPQVQWRRGLGVLLQGQCRVVESSWRPRFLPPSPPLLPVQ